MAFNVQLYRTPPPPLLGSKIISQVGVLNNQSPKHYLHPYHHCGTASPGATVVQPPGATVVQPPGATVVQPPGATVVQPPGAIT